MYTIININSIIYCIVCTFYIHFIVWDESTMSIKSGPEALDQTLRYFKDNGFISGFQPF